MSREERTVPPVQTPLPEEGADLGGIPSTLNQGVDHATDRAAGRREGTPESDAGGGPRPSLPVSGESAAVAPRPARDTTGSASAASAGSPSAGSPSSAPSVPSAASTTGTTGSASEGAAQTGDAGRMKGDGSGQDDSLAESLGKAIAEPFKSD